MSLGTPKHFDAMPWASQAACRGLDPALFHPEVGETAEAAHAKRVCADCPVRVDCLDYAIGTNQPDGIWGGLSVKQRQRLRRKLGKQRQPANHGTHTRYALGCRCPACTKAHADYCYSLRTGRPRPSREVA